MSDAHSLNPTPRWATPRLMVFVDVAFLGLLYV
jgi:hypothetical protein